MFNLRRKLKKVIATGCAITMTLSGIGFDVNEKFRSVEVNASTAGTTAYVASEEFKEITSKFITSRVKFEDCWGVNKISSSDLLSVESDIFEISNFFEENLNNMENHITASNETAYGEIEEFYQAVSAQLDVKGVFVASVNVIQKYKSSCTGDDLEKAANLLSATVDYQVAVNNTIDSVGSFLSKYEDNTSFQDIVKLTADFNGGTYTKQDNTVMTSDVVERFAYSAYRPAQPKKEGYVFSGWELVKGDGKIKNNIYYFGVEDATLKAIWIKEAIPTPTNVPTITPTVKPVESTPTAIPTATVVPTITPSSVINVTLEPTVEPITVTATPIVTQSTAEPPITTVMPPVAEQTAEPPTETVTPSLETPIVETMKPTVGPTETPIVETESPTEQPEQPTQEPGNGSSASSETSAPVIEQTEIPIIEATATPTAIVTSTPVATPTAIVTNTPVVTPTAIATKTPTPSPVALKKKTIKIGKGEKVSFPLKNKTGKKIKYTVKNKKIASVTSKGIIKGKKVGETKVYVTVSGKKLALTVKVRKKPVSIKISSVSKVKMSSGGKLILQAIMNNGAASYKLKWSSSNKKVVTVNSSGVATIKKKGKAVIKVKTYNGVTGTLKLNIK